VNSYVELFESDKQNLQNTIMASFKELLEKEDLDPKEESKAPQVSISR